MSKLMVIEKAFSKWEENRKKSDGDYAAPGTASDTACPFCGENSFDLLGLKSHLEHGDCEKYNCIDLLRRMF